VTANDLTARYTRYQPTYTLTTKHWGYLLRTLLFYATTHDNLVNSYHVRHSGADLDHLGANYHDFTPHTR